MSFFKRSKKLLGMTTSVVAKEVGLKISSTIKNNRDSELAKKLIRIQQAQTITKNLSQLKGAAMKAGQLMSLDSSDFLPEEARKVLSQLQSMAEPIKFEKIESTLKKELGDNLNFVEDLDITPVACASIGQVHRARYKNQDIVLKIQYPNIKESIDSDLNILKNLVQLLLIPTKKNIDLTETFQELSYVLHLETDYLNEAKMLMKAHSHLQEDEFFYAPQPVIDISTEKVLAMEFCEGVLLNEWISSHQNQKDKDFLAQKILDLFIIEFLDWNFVQTDPNFGNYLVQTNPFKVVLLDFGSTLIYTKPFIKNYLDTLYISSQSGPEEAFLQAVTFNLLDSREGETVKKLFFELMSISAEPFLSQQQPFDFSCKDYELRSKKTVINFTKALQYSPPPRQILFLHRKLGGIFNLLKILDTKIDLSVYWSLLMAKRDLLDSNQA